jgi:hypothetical protein
MCGWRGAGELPPEPMPVRTLMRYSSTGEGVKVLVQEPCFLVEFARVRDNHSLQLWLTDAINLNDSINTEVLGVVSPW